MKIFVYENIIMNYVSGYFYFVASEKEQADVMAKAFAKDHNKKVLNRNYMIEWGEEVKEYEIKPGYLPLNRITAEEVIVKGPTKEEGGKRL
jgi:hypothetical protein